MLFSTNTIASVLLLTGVVSAQTPAGFVPEVKEKLEIIFGTKTVATPGASLAKAGMCSHLPSKLPPKKRRLTLSNTLDTAKQPTLGVTGAPLNGTSYLWLMIGNY